MKELSVVGIVALLVAVDWAALHDIVKGEPNPYAEYGMAVFSVVAFGVMIVAWVRQKN